MKPNREAPTQFVPILNSNHDEKITDITKQCKLLEDALERAKNELIQEIDEHEKTVKEKVEIGRQLAPMKIMQEKETNNNR